MSAPLLLLPGGGSMEVDGAGEPGAAAEPGPSQTLYVHNLSERVRKEGACSGDHCAA